MHDTIVEDGGGREMNYAAYFGGSTSRHARFGEDLTDGSTVQSTLQIKATTKVGITLRQKQV